MLALKKSTLQLTNTMQHLAKEMNVWSKLEHPNILQLLGYVVEGDYPCLVSHWMDNGTVSRYLQDHPEYDLVKMVRLLFFYLDS